MAKARVWIGFAISLAFIYVAFRGQDLSRVWGALSRANYWYVIPALALYFAGVWVRAVRWSILLRPLRRLSARDLFPVVVIGYMANNALPLRAGELVRSYVLGNRTGVRKTSSLATIAVERLFDGLTMLGFILVASISIGLTSELRHLVLIAAALFGLALVGLVAVSLSHVRDRLLHAALDRLPARVAVPLRHATGAFHEGLGALRRRENLVQVALASVTAWLLEASMYAMVARGFGLGLDPASILLTTGVANLATLIPSSPGYVGPFEAGVLLALAGAVGIEREAALSFAVVVHAALYFPVTLWGLAYWWRESLSWRDVRQFSTEEAAG